MPENHETQISLESTLTLQLAVQRNFSTPVSLSYGADNFKKKIFAPLKTVGRPQNPRIRMNYIMASSNLP